MDLAIMAAGAGAVCLVGVGYLVWISLTTNTAPSVSHAVPPAGGQRNTVGHHQLGSGSHVDVECPTSPPPTQDEESA